MSQFDTFIFSSNLYYFYFIISFLLLYVNINYILPKYGALLQSFSPKNMPMWLLPLLTVVEILSYFLRPVSLGVRLFANMLAGHILLHILAGTKAFSKVDSFYLLYYILTFYVIIRNISINLVIFMLISYFVLYPLYIILFNRLNAIYSNFLLKVKTVFVGLLPYIPQPLFYLVYIYIFFIFLIRQYFIKERPSIIYLIGLVFMINLIYPNVFFPAFHITQYILFNLIFGLNLVSLDNLGSIFSDILLNHPDTVFSATYLTLTRKGLNHRSAIVRYVFMKAAAGVVFGKTPMTSTGRATIGVAVISGAGYLYGQHLKYKHEAEQNALNREQQNKATDLQREQFEYQKARDAKADAEKTAKKGWGWF